VKTDRRSLDPADWGEFRTQGHRMLEEMLDYLERIRGRPVWQPIPEETRAKFLEPLPRQPGDLAQVHETFMDSILPFAVGNAHPGFMGWVHGAGAPAGMLAEILAAGLNTNLGGRDQIPIEVERQILAWMRELFDFPPAASGIFVTGTSMANLLGLLVARTAALGIEVRRRGVAADGRRLVAYTSEVAHSCIAQAMDLSGFGSDALRLVRVNAGHEIDVAALDQVMTADRAAGRTPFLVAGTAGTVDIGAIDDLAALAEVAQRHRAWFHVDGAFGALGLLAPDVAPRLAGIQRADSIAFDFHKWGQVPYDAGYILVRDGTLHQQTFETSSSYLARDRRGMSANSPWPCDFGPDLSRGFRALKTWFTFKVYGAEALGRSISHCCELARTLQQRIESEPALEMLAPVPLNIVCFGFRCADPDRVNADLVVALQESGIAAPSSTVVNGRLAIRAAIVNHRTTRTDIDALVDVTIRLGRSITAA